MKSRNLKLLLVIFAGLLAFVLLPSFLDSVSENLLKNKSDFNRKKVLFKDFDITKVNSVMISRDENIVKLEKQDGVWLIEGKKATESEIVKLLNGILAIEVMELASKNPENHARLGVSDDSGYKVELTGEGVDVSIYAGNRGIKPNTFYVRKSDAEITYLVKGLLSGLSTNVSKWKDKVVVDAASKELTGVELSGVETATYGPEDENWEEIKTSFSPLTAFGFLSEEEIEEYDGTWRKTTVKLWFADGTDMSFDVYRGESAHWIYYNDEYYKVSFQNMPVFPDETEDL